MNAKVDRCPTCKRRLTRSSEANRRYWALLHALAGKLRPKGQEYSAETWHLYCKSRFLGADDQTLPSGRVITIPHSTAQLDSTGFAEYMTKVEAFANERGCFLEDMEGAA